MSSLRTAGEWPGLRVSLAEEVGGGRKVFVLIDASRRPAYVDSIGLPSRTEAEMKPRIAGRLVAAASETRCDPDTPLAVDRDDRTDGIAIRGRSLQTKSERMPAIGLIMEEGDRLILR